MIWYRMAKGPSWMKKTTFAMKGAAKVWLYIKRTDQNSNYVKESRSCFSLCEELQVRGNSKAKNKRDRTGHNLQAPASTPESLIDTHN